MAVIDVMCSPTYSSRTSGLDVIDLAPNDLHSDEIIIVVEECFFSYARVSEWLAYDIKAKPGTISCHVALPPT